MEHFPVARLRELTARAELEKARHLFLTTEDARALLTLIDSNDTADHPTLWSDELVAGYLKQEGLERMGGPDGYGVDVYQGDKLAGSGRYLREAIADYRNKKEAP